MKHLTQYILLAASLLMAPAADAQQAFCGQSNNSFHHGEKLTYRVYYNMGSIWVKAGEAVFTVNQKQYEGRNVYHIAGDGRTYSSYDWFFKVRDRYETFIDVETLLPVRFLRNVNEGGFKIFNSVTFDHRNGRAISTNGSFIIPQCTQDVLSSIYYARNIDYSKLKPGAKVPFTMFLDDEVFHLYIRYLGKEKIRTRYGTFNTLKIRPLLIEGTIFKGGERMTVWVSDDANHIPVRVDSPILVGSIKVDLVGHERLRNPFLGFLKGR